ncbi:MAG: DUF1320 domain-containing protein [Sphingomonas sp.]
MYATADDMRAEYGEDILVQLADAPAWGEAAIATINKKLVGASVLIDGFVAKYYAHATGLGVPPLLNRIACEIAYCDMHRAPTDDAKERKAGAMKLLAQISTGQVKLDQGKANLLPARQGAVIVPDAPRTFSRDSLKGF